MRKGTKLWLWITVSVVLFVCIIFVVVMSMAGWDFSKLATGNYVSNEYVITDAFQNISIDSNVANIVLLPTDDGTTKVVCREREKGYHQVTVQDDTLVILAVGAGKWTDNISAETAKITVYMPLEKYSGISVRTKTGDVNCFVSAEKVHIAAGTGNIFVQKIHAGAMELTVSTGVISVINVTCDGEIRADTATGRMNITNVHCGSFSSTGSTGDVILEQLIADEGIFVRRNTGDVKFDRCDANALIRVEANTGDVKGSFLSDKIFAVKTDTGDVDVPESVEGNAKCQISTGTGNVKITIHYE